MGTLEEMRKRRMLRMLQNQEAMAKYQNDKNSLSGIGKQIYEVSGNVNQIGDGINKLGTNVGNDKIASIGSKMQTVSGRPALDGAKAKIAEKLGLGSGVASAGTAGASMAGTTGVGGSAIANGIASAVPSATSAGVAGAGTAGSSALGSSALGSSLLSATGGAGAGAMGTAGATSALSGATAGATAGAGAGMGAGATALGMAGPIGAAILAGYAIYNMVKSAKAKKNAKAMQKDMEAMNNNEQLANQNKAEMQNNFAQGAQNNLAQLDNETQTQLDPTGSMDMEIQEAIANGEPTGFATPVPNYGQMVQDAIAKQTQQTVPSTIQEPDAFANVEAGINNVPQTTLVDNSTIADNIANQAPVEDKKSGILAKLTDMAGDFKEGFNENVSEGFSPENLRADKAKSIMNRVGELAGTGVRTLGKPGVQGLIAGGISRAQGNDWGNAIATGVDYAQKRQVADHYYKALNPEAKFTPLFSGLGADDYKAHTMNEYRGTLNDLNKAKMKAKLDETNPTMSDYALTQLASGEWTDEQYNDYINSENYKPDNRINTKVLGLNINQQNADTNVLKAKTDKDYKAGVIANQKERNAITADKARQSAEDKARENEEKATKEAKKRQDEALKNGDSILIRVTDPSTGQITDKVIPVDKLDYVKKTLGSGNVSVIR